MNRAESLLVVLAVVALVLVPVAALSCSPAALAGQLTPREAAPNLGVAAAAPVTGGKVPLPPAPGGAECINFVGDVPMPPNIKPVIILAGTDYEMGYQFVQQSIEVWGKWVASHQWLTGSWCFTPINRGGTYTDAERKALQAYQWYIKKDVPEFIDFMKGMTAAYNDSGIPMTYEDVLALQVRRYYTEGVNVPHIPGSEPPGSEKEKLPPKEDACSGFAAWGRATKDGKLICSGSADSGNSLFQVTLVVFPKTGNKYIYCPYRTMSLGSSGMPGMNDKGLAYVHHGGVCPYANTRCKGSVWDAYGTPWGLYHQHILRFANNTSQAETMLLNMTPQQLTYNEGLWADVSGDCLVAEGKELTRRAGDHGEIDFLHATNNGMMREVGLPGEAYYEHGGWGTTDASKPGSSVSRNLTMWNLLHPYPGKVDLEFAKMMWRYQTMDPANPCIGHYDNMHTTILIPDNGNKGQCYVSSRVPARTSTPGSNYKIEPIHSYYRLALSENPGKVTEAARATAQSNLWTADTNLRKLSWKDAAYAPLDQVFNKAVENWYQGQHYLYLGTVTKGNEAISNYSKAARAYTRCQAYALEVYESLVPPPTKPADLGL